MLEATEVTNEVAILRAYALLSQRKYGEAEQMLKIAPGALKTPSGADLFARLRFEQGFSDEARQIWERLHAMHPDFVPAAKALEAFVNPPPSDDKDGGGCILTNGLCSRLMIVAIALGVTFLLWRSIGCRDASHVDNTFGVVVETTISEKMMSDATLRELRRGFLTNFNDRCALIVKGGSGRYITDRQKKLAVIAECISEGAKIPSTKIFFQPAVMSTEDIVLQVVPAYLERGGGANEGE